MLAPGIGVDVLLVVADSDDQQLPAEPVECQVWQVAPDAPTPEQQCIHIPVQAG
jgi:hypothetical protein